MYEIGHGINVYFNNQKDARNIVFLPDTTYKYYDDGGMLFEVIGDEAIYMLTEKVQNMIKAFPDRYLDVTSENITAGFKWLYGTIEDDERPVATELFRSSFNDAIQQVLAGMSSPEDYESVAAFYMACYDLYSDHVKTFCVFVQAIAADASGFSDEFQHEVASVFVKSAEELYECYSKKCTSQRIHGHVSVETVQITNFLQLLTFEYCRMKKMHKAVKECANCGRWFIPVGRVDSIYCTFPAPTHPGKTCREVGPQLRRAEKRRSDPREREHHKIICRLYNNVRRAKESGDSDDTIERYTKEIDAEMIKYGDEKSRGNNGI